MIRLFQTWRHLASEASSGHGQHHDLPRGGGKEESLTVWACSSNPALRSQSGWCYLSQCVWRNQPGPKQNGNMKLPGNTGFVGGLWDYVGRSLHITSFLAGGREGSYHGPSLTYGLGFFFLPNGSCFLRVLDVETVQYFSTCQPYHCQSPRKFNSLAYESGEVAPINSFLDVSEGVVPCGYLLWNNSAFVLQLKFIGMYY